VMKPPPSLLAQLHLYAEGKAEARVTNQSVI
jgi:hypothetical protein